MNVEFSQFERDFLQEAAQMQRDCIGQLQSFKVVERLPYDVPTDWVDVIFKHLDDKGLLVKSNPHSAWDFRLSGEGIRVAEEIDIEKSKGIFRRFLDSVGRSDWIAIGALIVSVIALFKGD